MTDTWQRQLEAFGATVTDGAVQHFGNLAQELSAANNSTVLADLSHLGLIQVSGADVLTFLQGQLTQDVEKISGEHADYAGFCSPKGRLLAHFFAWRSGDSYLLQLPRELIEPIQKRLKMYVLRSKVALADVSTAQIRFGLAGAKAANVITSVFGNAPTQPMDKLRTPLGAVIALPNARFQINVSGDAADRWQAVAKSATPVGAAVWRWLQIRAGVPEIYTATQEQFVPQMINDDLIGAVSFQKGCYTGQEIVARLHYLGKVKRRMVGAHLDTPDAAQPGDPIYGTRLAGQAIGMVVDAAAAPQGGWDLLVSIPVGDNLDTAHYFKVQNGPTIQIED